MLGLHLMETIWHSLAFKIVAENDIKFFFTCRKTLMASSLMALHLNFVINKNGITSAANFTKDQCTIKDCYLTFLQECRCKSKT